MGGVYLSEWIDEPGRFLTNKITLLREKFMGAISDKAIGAPAGDPGILEIIKTLLKHKMPRMKSAPTAQRREFGGKWMLTRMMTNGLLGTVVVIPQETQDETTGLYGLGMIFLGVASFVVYVVLVIILARYK